MSEFDKPTPNQILTEQELEQIVRQRIDDFVHENSLNDTIQLFFEIIYDLSSSGTVKRIDLYLDNKIEDFTQPADDGSSS